MDLLKMIQVQSKVRNIFVILMFVVIALLAFRSLISDSFIYTTWDFYYPLTWQQAYNRMMASTSIINYMASLGFADNQRPTGFYYFLMNIPIAYVFGIHGVKAVMVIFTVIAGLGTYVLLRRIRIPAGISFLMGVYYMFNPALFSRLVSGHIDLFMALAVLPLFTVSEWLFLRKPGIFRFAAVMMLLTVTSFHSQSFMLAFFISVPMIAYKLIFSHRKGIILASSLLIFVGSVTTQAHWLFPMMGNYISTKPYFRGDIAQDTEMAERKSKLASTANPVTYPLFMINNFGFITEYSYRIANRPLFILAQTVFYALCSLYFLILIIRRDRHNLKTYSFLIVWFSFSVALTSGSGNTVGKWLYEYVIMKVPPVFFIFGNSNRFLPLVVLGIVVLSGVALGYFYRYGRTRRYLVVSAALLVFIRTFGYFDNSLFTPMNMLTLPFAYRQESNDTKAAYLTSVLTAHHENRIGFLPPAQSAPVNARQFNWATQAHMSNVGDYFSDSANRNPFQMYTISLMSSCDTVTENLGKVMGLANVGEVFFPEYMEYYFFGSYGCHKLLSQNEYLFSSDRSLEKTLDLQTDLRKISPVPGVRKYENSANLPLLYGFDTLYIALGGYETLLDVAADRDFDFRTANIAFVRNVPQSLLAEADGFIVKNYDTSDLTRKFIPEGYRLPIMSNKSIATSNFFQGEFDLSVIPSKNKGIVLPPGDYPFETGRADTVLFMKFARKPAPGMFSINAREIGNGDVSEKGYFTSVIGSRASVTVKDHVFIEDMYLLPEDTLRQASVSAGQTLSGKPLIRYGSSSVVIGAVHKNTNPVNDVVYKKIDPAQYRIHTEKKPKYLYFSTSFDPDWVIGNTGVTSFPGGAEGIIFKLNPQMPGDFSVTHRSRQSVRLGYAFVSLFWIALALFVVKHGFVKVLNIFSSRNRVQDI